jgi:chemotaxis protein CheZ
MAKSASEPATPHEIDVLKRELKGLFDYIQRVRQEIAAIHRPADAEHKFNSIGEELDAIVQSTEEATHTIMETMETNQALLEALRAQVKDPKLLAGIDRIVENGNAVFEACSFQDITGQRISKITRSLTYVEARVNALVDIWGKAQLEKVEVRPEREKSADEKLLHGPQLKGQAISQAEIDKLFE